MNDRIIDFAALNTTDRIMDLLVRSHFSEKSRGEAWKEIFALVKAGTIAVIECMEDGQQQRLKPGKN